MVDSRTSFARNPTASRNFVAAIETRQERGGSKVLHVQFVERSSWLFSRFNHF
jgi:hypothetical protein